MVLVLPVMVLVQKKAQNLKACETCNGMGQVRIQQGFFSIQQTCPSCHGEGQIISDPCTVVMVKDVFAKVKN